MRGLVARAIAGLVRWAVVESDGADRGPVPFQQVRSMDQSGRSVAWYPYGFHAVAPAGTLAARLLVSGQADAVVHLPGSPKERPRLAAGEVAAYHPETGSSVIFRADGTVEVDATANLRATVAGDASVVAGNDVAVVASGDVVVSASAAATVIAPAIALTGPVTITGTLHVTGAATFDAAIIDSNTIDHVGHVHDTVSGLGDGNTGPPE